MSQAGRELTASLKLNLLLERFAGRNVRIYLRSAYFRKEDWALTRKPEPGEEQKDIQSRISLSDIYFTVQQWTELINRTHGLRLLTHHQSHREPKINLIFITKGESLEDESG
jgi:hypothetical protein